MRVVFEVLLREFDKALWSIAVALLRESIVMSVSGALTGPSGKANRVSASNPRHSFSSPRLSVKITNCRSGSPWKNGAHGNSGAGFNSNGTVTLADSPSANGNPCRIRIAWWGPVPSGRAILSV